MSSVLYIQSLSAIKICNFILFFLHFCHLQFFSVSYFLDKCCLLKLWKKSTSDFPSRITNLVLKCFCKHIFFEVVIGVLVF